MILNLNNNKTSFSQNSPNTVSHYYDKLFFLAQVQCKSRFFTHVFNYNNFFKIILLKQCISRRNSCPEV